MAEPPLLNTATPSPKVPMSVGAKVTVSVTLWPGASVLPAAGAPAIEKGGWGTSISENVSGWLPEFVKSKLVLREPPMGSPPNESPLAATLSEGPRLCPIPCSEIDAAPASVPTLSEAT